MNVTTLEAPAAAAELMERVLLAGDLATLTADDRVRYYTAVCESLKLNPLTKPFDYLTLNSKLVLYPTRTATDQLREQRRVSLEITSREVLGDVYVVTARATLPDGRTDESTGAVSIAGLQREALANAYMKAETKAKRRVTLSIVGLGWMDESEVDSVPTARPVAVDIATGRPEEPAQAPMAGAALPAAEPLRISNCEQCGGLLAWQTTAVGKVLAYDWADGQRQGLHRGSCAPVPWRAVQLEGKTYAQRWRSLLHQAEARHGVAEDGIVELCGGAVQPYLQQRRAELGKYTLEQFLWELGEAVERGARMPGVVGAEEALVDAVAF